ncbi:MAG: hypothetical protein HZA64_05255 [Rhodocyclales bacterium]|nr:hypothetical protein [Rhodocyclales bacterium]
MRTSIIRYTLLATAALLLAACASPANREAMTPTLTLATHNPYAVQVKTGGGATEGPSISDEDLKAAIEAAIVESKLFKTVVQGADGANYELNVMITSLERPAFGLTFTVELETAWSLVKVSDRSVTMRKSIKSTGVATPGDAFVAATRIRLAVERAAQNNISDGLKAVAEVKL